MPTPSLVQPTASSGIQTNRSGERHIPQSVRADGSIRKEIKVRPGYRPPEDVELYKNRTADGWKSRLQAGVPGAEAMDEGNECLNKSERTKSKNAKRRDARKKAKSTDTADDSQDIGKVRANSQMAPTDVQNSTGMVQSGETLPEEPTGRNPPSKVEPTKPGEEAPIDGEVELEKHARNLKKKLRQARELQSKKESGEALLPEQFAKVIKIQELTRQLDALGFDSDGARKP